METASLKSLCEMVVDCPHFTPEWTKSGYIVLRNQNIRNGRLDLSSPSFTHKTDFDRRNRRAKPRSGDIIFTREAPMGEVCMVPDGLECCIGQRQVLLRPKAEVSGRYLFYALQSPFVRHQILWNEGTGSTVSNVRIPILEALQIPRLGDQEALIGDLLYALDDKIELNRRMNETLEAMAQGVFCDWFVDFGPVRRKVAGERDPIAIMGGVTRDAARAAELAKLFPDAMDEAGLPRGWSWKTIGECCSRIFSGGTPATTVSDYWNGDIPWLSSGETRNSVVIRTERTISKTGVENSSTRLARRFNTVVASAGQGNTRGQAALLAEDMYINQSVIALSANLEVTTAVLVFLDLSRRYDELRRISDSNSSRGSLTTKMVSSLRTAIAPPRTMKGLGGVLDPLFEKLIANQREALSLTQARDYLLPRLMSGKVRVATVAEAAEPAA